MKYYVAIPDIHGDFDKLESALEDVKAWLGFKGLSDVGHFIQYIFLGDYIDRHNQENDVLKCIITYVEKGAILLLGNHDYFLVGTGNKSPQQSFLWDINGGYDTCYRMYGDLSNYDESLQMDMTELASMDQYLLDNHIDARRYNSRETTYRYCKIIKQSWQFKFLESAQISYETDKIFFCHAPQSIVKPDPTFHQLIWGNSADFDIDTDRKFKVPNNKTISVHGHYHRLSEGVNFPRIHNYRHGGLFRQVVLADCGCGCFGGTTEGKLHPVILSEDDNSTRIEVIL